MDSDESVDVARCRGQLFVVWCVLVACFVCCGDRNVDYLILLALQGPSVAGFPVFVWSAQSPHFCLVID